MNKHMTITSTYDHRLKRTGDPVRSAMMSEPQPEPRKWGLYGYTHLIFAEVTLGDWLAGPTILHYAAYNEFRS
jgi:hypothetical protein